MVTWEIVAADFVPDGSLRDLYVLRTDVSDWQRFMDYLLASDLRLNLTVDDESSDLPMDKVDALFAAKERATVLLRIGIGEIRLYCHFFGTDDIELDLDPKEITEANLPTLLHFMRSVGRRLAKDFVVTGENMPHCPFLIPGYGAQGGKAEDVKHGFLPDGTGAIVSSSQGIIYASSGEDWKEATRKAAMQMAETLKM